MIVAVTSWRGVGTTTTALLLAASFAERDLTWLVEADPAGGVLAGRIHFEPSAIGGLERIAFPVDQLDSASAFAAVAHPIGQLRVVAAPADPFRAYACHAPRWPWQAALRELAGSVVVDVGRLRAATPAWPLLEIADAIVLVVSPEVSAAVASVEWLRASGRVSPMDRGLEAKPVRVAAVDAPAGVAFGRDALERELGEQFGAWLPWDPTAVDGVHRGVGASDRRHRRSGLFAAAARLAASIPQHEEVAA